MLLNNLALKGPDAKTSQAFVLRWASAGTGATALLKLSGIEYQMDEEQFFQRLQMMVEAWCDRRALTALRCVLRGYPLSSPLTDGWAELMSALKDVRAFAREEITPEELITIDECVRALERTVYRR
jgi:hypothetical protein